MAKYQFISKYGKYDVQFGLGERDINGRYKRRARCVFINAIFETDDEEVAQGLEQHPLFGVDFHLNLKQQEVTSKYGNDSKLGEKLEKLRRQTLVSLCTRQKIPREDAFKRTKAELINLLLRKPERTEALLNEAV